MRPPYEALLGHYRGTWYLGDYIPADPAADDAPDWRGIADDPRLDALGAGEKCLIDFAAAWANCDAYLDDENRYRVMCAMAAVCGMGS